ncbi:hypothetical protein A2W13_00235 [Candidatus Woesebacteria bacterium RBG_16_36_11]|uniref:CD-NTase-associated protein 12/Pycsar effector protein TIR domain-containing protein n=1 Tax=Candidatus Woesebacteria bacterium RBG_16_36_11 TaxID=1802481 RepID=A0A1F7X7C0_9BACT|nr:MAG: hypothetical protein A2W13_00235 [Candidatus Woesebacteria bacterium RBG_16_36_11]
MKVFISGDTPDGFICKMIKGWKHEVFSRLPNGENTISEGDIISNMKDTDIAIFFLSPKQKEKIGIRDHLTAFSMGIPSVSIILKSENNIGISENLKLLSDKVIEVQNRNALRDGIREFISNPPSRKESKNSSLKERY